MKSKKSIWIGLIVLVAVVAVFLAVYFLNRPDTESGNKVLTIAVVHKDGTENDFEISTDAEYLADALTDNGIVEDNQSEYGLYILTADGETVDESQQEWWCLTQDGDMLMTGASETATSDGDHYEITFTVGYE